MEYKDYYILLGITRDATQDEIKRAYRKLTRKYHPDVSKEPNAEQKFKEVGEAYEVLKDPEKRVAYDQLGTGWKSGQEFKPPPNREDGYAFRGGGFTEADPSDFSDFFASLFGKAETPRRKRHTNFHSRGEDIHATIQIDLEDSYHGSTRTLSLQVPEVDDHGLITTRERVLNVHIPKGVTSGQQIRLSGQGAPGLSEASAGDLYLKVELKPHPFFRIEDKDIYLDLPVAPWEAALGAKVKVPTPGGVVDLKIPADSASGSKLRLRGRGLHGNPSGDLYMILQIALPPANSQQAKELYLKMEQDLPFNPRSRLGV